jgi:hypothetical protein
VGRKPWPRSSTATAAELAELLLADGLAPGARSACCQLAPDFAGTGDQLLRVANQMVSG